MGGKSTLAIYIYEGLHCWVDRGTVCVDVGLDASGQTQQAGLLNSTWLGLAKCDWLDSCSQFLRLCH